jgi:hypothetical protein
VRAENRGFTGINRLGIHGQRKRLDRQCEEVKMSDEQPAELAGILLQARLELPG